MKNKEKLVFFIIGISVAGAALSILTGLFFDAPAPYIFSVAFSLLGGLFLPFSTLLLK